MVLILAKYESEYGLHLAIFKLAVEARHNELGFKRVEDGVGNIRFDFVSCNGNRPTYGLRLNLPKPLRLDLRILALHVLLPYLSNV